VQRAGLDGFTFHGLRHSFVAILVAAGASRVPPALKKQLKIGGRLVIPLGDADGAQELVKLVRRAENDFEEEHLGAGKTRVTVVAVDSEQPWHAEQYDTSVVRDHRGHRFDRLRSQRRRPRRARWRLGVCIRR